MDERRERRLAGILGAFLLLGTVGILLWGRLGRLNLTAAVAVQMALLGGSGLCNVVAAGQTLLTDRIPWHRWHGVGNVLLGGSLPVGIVGSGDSSVLAAVTALGALVPAAMGVDLIVFDGRFTHGESFRGS
jgi:hypothetical protein